MNRSSITIPNRPAIEEIVVSKENENKVKIIKIKEDTKKHIFSLSTEVVGVIKSMVDKLIDVEDIHSEQIDPLIDDVCRFWGERVSDGLNDIQEWAGDSYPSDSDEEPLMNNEYDECASYSSV